MLGCGGIIRRWIFIIWKRQVLSNRRNVCFPPVTCVAGPKVFIRFEENVVKFSHVWRCVSYSVPLEFKPLTSIRTQAPIPYKSLRLCKDSTSIDDDDDDNNHNLGETLQGWYDQTESSPYVLKMKEEMYCQQLCISNLGWGEQRGVTPNKVVKSIRNQYHHNWIVDKLMAASKFEDDSTITTRYAQGFPMGFINTYDKKAYVHNHVNIEIMYHPVENQVDKFRVVRLTVEPFSIKHDFLPIIIDDEATITEEDIARGNSNDTIPSLTPVAAIKNPIASCNPAIPASQKSHTNYYMVTDRGREPQEASGHVLFTYDVFWTQYDDLHWTDRWDIYMSMDNAIPSGIHLYSFFKSMFILTITFGIILTAYLRRLRNAAKLAPIGDNAAAADDDDEEQQEEPKARRGGCFACCTICSRGDRQMWRLLHGDVFRPPKFALPLAVCCGTGAHLLSTCIVWIIVGTMGVWHPSRQPFVLLDMVLVYVVLGGVGGFVTEQKCQELGINDLAQRINATLWTALGFPGLLYSFFLGVFLWGKQIESTWDIGTTSILSLLSLWLLVMAPLTFLGSWIGRRRIVKEFPVEIAAEPRAIPKKTCFMGCFCPVFSFVMNAYWSLGAGFTELYLLIWTWMYYPHPPFPYLAIGFALVVATCSLVNILTTYWQLCRENHRWWWCSFRNGASAGFFLWAYSAMFFFQLEATGFFAYYLYFGSMTLVSIALGVILGYVGMSSSTWFNRAIFGLIVHTH